MRFATSFEHRDFFSKNGYIEFEGLITLDECALLLSKEPGRDLWRKDVLVKRISLRPQFGEIASVLSHKKTLRIGFDQLLDPKNPILLADSCLKPTIGLLIILTGEKAGSGIFFNPESPMPAAEHAFLIIYSDTKTIYHLNKKDPHTHALKKLGYVFGDLVKSDTHPFIHA